MRALVFLLFFIVSAFGELDFYSKTRNFSVELLHNAVQESYENIVISPYSMWYLLISIAYETSGETREQFFKVLSLPEERSEVVEELVKQRRLVLTGGNVFNIHLLYDAQVNDSSESIFRLSEDFGFVLHPGQQPLNYWLSLGNSTMIMYNLFNFHAEWTYPFNVSAIVQDKRPTSLYSGVDSAKTEFDDMYLKARLRSSELEPVHASVTELPYRGGRYCMLLLRPHRGYDVRQVLRNLRGISLTDVFAKLQSDVDEFGLREVEVKLPTSPGIPSILVDSYVNLNKPLLKMGLSDMFDENSANFDSFAEDKIYIGETSQNIVLTMSEKYTDVQSETPGLYLKRGTAVEKDPLIFIVMEKSSVTMLFGGIYSKVIVENPSLRVNSQYGLPWI